MFLFVFNIDGADLAHGVSPTFKFVDYCAKKKKKKKKKKKTPGNKKERKRRTGLLA